MYKLLNWRKMLTRIFVYIIVINAFVFVKLTVRNQAVVLVVCLLMSSKAANLMWRNICKFSYVIQFIPGIYDFLRFTFHVLYTLVFFHLVSFYYKGALLSDTCLMKAALWVDSLNKSVNDCLTILQDRKRTSWRICREHFLETYELPDAFANLLTVNTFVLQVQKSILDWHYPFFLFYF